MSNTKAKRSVKWEAGAYIWITVAAPKRDPFKIDRRHQNDCKYFYDWLIKNKIAFRTRQIGGGKFDGLIELEEWPKVKKFLKENGYEQGSTAIPAETEEE